MANKGQSILIILAMTIVLFMNSVVIYIVAENSRQRADASRKASDERRETKCILLIPQEDRIDSKGNISQRVKDCAE